MKPQIKCILIVFLLSISVTACSGNKDSLNPKNSSSSSSNKISDTSVPTSTSSAQIITPSENKQDSDITLNNNLNQQSKKQEYKAKLDKLDLEFKKFNNDSATTNDMYQEACKEYKQWDDALNEIYGVLKVQLSISDMKKVQSEQIQWIKDRDAEAKKNASEMAGGSMEKVLYEGSLANSTKERCYVFVDKYMK